MKRCSNFILAALAVLMVTVSGSQAALNSYMWIKDASGADIRGSVTIAGREGSVEVVALDQNVYVPIDPVTRQPAGARKHDPFVFTKSIDASTPLLNDALCRNRVLSQVVIRSYQVNDEGVEVEYFSCVLEDVKVVKVAPVLNDVFDSKKKAVPLEQVSLLYNKVTWTFQNGNIQFSDELGPGNR